MLAKLFGRDSTKSMSSGMRASCNNHRQVLSLATGLDPNNSAMHTSSPQTHCDEQSGVVEGMEELVNLSKRFPVTVSIPSYRVNDSYIEYVIECVQGQKYWQVYRRYQQFKALDHSLRHLCTRGTPNHGDHGVLPVLPGSHWMEVTNQSTQLVEKRRRYLEIYLQQLLVPGNLFYVAHTPLYIFLHNGEVVLESKMHAIQPLIGFSVEAVEVESELCASTSGQNPHEKCGEAAGKTIVDHTSTHSHDSQQLSKQQAEVPFPLSNVPPDGTKTELPTVSPPTFFAPLAPNSASAAITRLSQAKIEPSESHTTQELQQQQKGQSLLVDGSAVSGFISSMSGEYLAKGKSEAYPQCQQLTSLLPQEPPQTCVLSTPDHNGDKDESLNLAPEPQCSDAALRASSYDIHAWDDGDAPSEDDDEVPFSLFLYTVDGQGAPGLGSGEKERLSSSHSNCRSCHEEFSSSLYPHRCFFCRNYFCFHCLWRFQLRCLLDQMPPCSDAESNRRALENTKPDSTKDKEKRSLIKACSQCTESYKRRLPSRCQGIDNAPVASSAPTAAKSPLVTAGNLESDGKHQGGETSTSGGEKGGVPAQVAFHDFQLITLLGHGAFGRVIKVRFLPTGAIYAMKMLNKSLVHQRCMDSYLKEERSILTMLPPHPYIVNCHFAFQTDYYIVFILDYLPGGELYDVMYRRCRLTQSAVQLYMAELVLAIEHIHRHDVVHRDIKAENILLDADGHLRLNDFGLAHGNFSKYIQRTFVGSAEYVAPEMVRYEKQTPALDWWSLGVLMYEMLHGHTPFRAESKNGVYENITSKELDLSNRRILTPEAASLIQALLNRDVNARLQNAVMIKEHPYFSGINWDALLRREVPAPFVPQLADNNTRYFKRDFTAEWAAVPEPPNRVSSSIETLKQCFDSFPYVKDSVDGCSSDPRSGFNTSPQVSPPLGFPLSLSLYNLTPLVIGKPDVPKRAICQDQLVGVWRVVKVETRDLSGRVIYPWGGDIVGCLIYTPIGFFSMQLAPVSRRCLQHPHHPRDASCEELCDIYCSYVAQFGRYEVDDAKPCYERVCHHIEGCLSPNQSGHSVVLGLSLRTAPPPNAPGVGKTMSQEFTLPACSAPAWTGDDAKHYSGEEDTPSAGRSLLSLSTALHYVSGKPFKAQTIITWEKVDVPQSSA